MTIPLIQFSSRRIVLYDIKKRNRLNDVHNLALLNQSHICGSECRLNFNFHRRGN